MRLLGIAVLALSLLFSCAPSYTSAETAAEIQEYAAETADSLTDTGVSAGPDIRYLLLLQDFRSSIFMPRYIRSRTPTDEQAPPVGLKAGRKELSMLPSEIKLKSYYGYHRNIFEGWQKLPEAAITGEGYTVEFSRLSECTIDRMCDALNGWYNIWTKFCCEFTDRKGTLSITVRKPEDADKLYNMLSDIKPIMFEHEGTTSAADAARIKMETMIGWIRNQRK